jgi:hypothetical protein
MPADFEKKLDKDRDEGAIVFDGIDYFQVWFFLMLKRYDILAKHFVDLAEEPRTEEEVIALLEKRTDPILRDEDQIRAAAATA